MKKYALLIILFLAFVFDAMAQETVPVRGTVRDRADGEPLPGVTIIYRLPAESAARGIATDLNGRFLLNVPINTQLRATFMGFDTVHYVVTRAINNLDLFMTERTNALNELVIIGNNQHVRRAETTATVTVIKTSDLVATPVASVMDLMQGLSPGLNVQLNTGLPGAVGTYTIRGISDISIDPGSGELIPSTPLFVVDGIPMDIEEFDMQGLIAGSGVSPLAFIPVEDIDNIQILRDAVATSMYGSKGAYGVILINTKKGDSPKPQISYSANFTVNTPPRLRDVVVGRDERMARVNAILENDTSYMYAQFRVNSNLFLSDSLNAYWNNNTDWQNVFYRVTFNQTHNLSFSGGDPKFNYRVSGGLYSEKGILQNTELNTYTLRTSMGYNPIQNFSISTNVNVGIALNSTGSGSVFEQQGVATGANTSSLLPPPSMYVTSNEILGALAVDDNRKTINYDASVNMTYRLPWRQSINGQFGYSLRTTDIERFTPGMLRNNEAQISGNSSNSTNLFARVHTGYTHQLSVIRIGMNVAFEVTARRSFGNEVGLRGLTGDNIRGPIGYSPRLSGGNATATAESATVMFSIHPVLGFGRARLGNEKYVFTPGINPEINSSYGDRARWTVNPILGFRWNFSEEEFMKNINFLSSGALKASWGKTTRYRASIYEIWGSYTLNAGTYGGRDYIPADLSRLPNVNLEPVTNTQWDIGTELNFLKNRYNLNANVYYRQIDNQLNTSGIANHNSFTNFRNTEISLVNYGLELGTGFRPLPSQSVFNLYVGFNFTINRDVTARLPNRARQLNTGTGQETIVNRVGSNTLSNHLLVYKGVYATDEDVPVDPATGRRLRVGGTSPTEAHYFRAGDPIWVDINGDYIIDDNDKVVIGNSQPRAHGGININLSYKNAIRFAINFSYVARRDIINAALAERFATYSNPLRQNALVPISAYNFWTPEHYEQGRVADYPNPYDFTRASIINPFRPDQTVYMEDGSFFKIQNASLSYTIPREWSNRIGIRSMSVTASINNIWTFSRYSGINPENVNSLGFDRSGGYPNSRRFAFGTQINF